MNADTSREKILQKIRKAQGREGKAPTPAELQAVRDHIARREVGPLPSIAGASDPVSQFREECARLSTTFADLEHLADVPREVARYLAGLGLEPRIVAWPAHGTLDWAQAGITCEARPAHGTDRTGLTGCFCAIAETGSLLLLSGPDEPKVNALLPDTHIAIVSRTRLVPTMEAAFGLLRAERGELPRATFFVSGPSRTADIEQTIVIGAHGPYRVHAILVP